MRQTLARFNQTGIKHSTANRDRFGHSQTYGVFGNVGMGRHYNPTTNFTLEDMRRRSIVYSDVYLDGWVQKNNITLARWKRQQANNIFKIRKLLLGWSKSIPNSLSRACQESSILQTAIFHPTIF